MLSRLGATAVRWLFPARCAGCRKVGAVWCTQCQAQTHVLREPVCARCGYPLPEPRAECPACQHEHFDFAQARAWGSYAGPLRRAILKLKHKRNAELGAVLSRNLAAAMPRQWSVDGVVPVPLSTRRAAQRGYNPVELLAGPLARELGLPVAASALWRARDTLPQMTLRLEQRWANVQDAFVGNAEAGGRRLLLVDDIFTSGATAQAATRALRAAGAEAVYVLALARTL